MICLLTRMGVWCNGDIIVASLRLVGPPVSALPLTSPAESGTHQSSSSVVDIWCIRGGCCCSCWPVEAITRSTVPEEGGSCGVYVGRSGTHPKNKLACWICRIHCRPTDMMTLEFLQLSHFGPLLASILLVEATVHPQPIRLKRIHWKSKKLYLTTNGSRWILSK